MTAPRSLGYDKIRDREILFLSLDALTTPFTLPTIIGRQFVCFCAMDAAQFGVKEISQFCGHLVRLGCAYLSTWGVDCERVHDIMDEIIVGDNPPETDIGCLMTTWHAKDSLEEALEFFMFCTIPDEAYAPQGCEVGLIITIGSDTWAPAIERFVTECVHPASE